MESIELATEKTMESLELSTAKEMVAHYQATRKKLIDETHGINDTRSIWFDIEGFRNFVNNLPENTSGVRVHLAAYGQENQHAPNQTTVIFTATVEKDGRDTDAMESSALFDLGDFDPFNKGKACPPYC